MVSWARDCDIRQIIGHLFSYVIWKRLQCDVSTQVEQAWPGWIGMLGHLCPDLCSILSPLAQWPHRSQLLWQISSWEGGASGWDVRLGQRLLTEGKWWCATEKDCEDQWHSADESSLQSIGRSLGRSSGRRKSWLVRAGEWIDMVLDENVSFRCCELSMYSILYLSQTVPSPLHDQIYFCWHNIVFSYICCSFNSHSPA